MDLAITREKQLKQWKRAWKIELIEKLNPTWRYLFEETCGAYIANWFLVLSSRRKPGPPEDSPHELCKPNSLRGSPEFTNEVQHQIKVLRWDRDTHISRWKTAAQLPDFVPKAVRSGKLLQLWIARHRAFLAS